MLADVKGIAEDDDSGADSDVIVDQQTAIEDRARYDLAELEDGFERAEMPTFFFALSEAAFNFLQEHDPDLLDRIQRRIVVYGKVSPAGKVAVVRSLQRSGYIVGMCGDGGNDCAALRAAHAGMALSEGDASIVAAFATPRKSLFGVVELIRQGRCCLRISTALFEFNVVVGAVVTVTLLVNLYAKASYADVCKVGSDQFPFVCGIVLAFGIPPVHGGLMTAFSSKSKKSDAAEDQNGGREDGSEPSTTSLAPSRVSSSAAVNETSGAQQDQSRTPLMAGVPDTLAESSGIRARRGTADTALLRRSTRNILMLSDADEEGGATKEELAEAAEDEAAQDAAGRCCGCCVCSRREKWKPRADRNGHWGMLSASRPSGTLAQKTRVLTILICIFWTVTFSMILVSWIRSQRKSENGTGWYRWADPVMLNTFKSTNKSEGAGNYMTSLLVWTFLFSLLMLLLSVARDGRWRTRIWNNTMLIFPFVFLAIFFFWPFFTANSLWHCVLRLNVDNIHAWYYSDFKAYYVFRFFQNTWNEVNGSGFWFARPVEEKEATDAASRYRISAPEDLLWRGQWSSVGNSIAQAQRSPRQRPHPSLEVTEKLAIDVKRGIPAALGALRQVMWEDFADDPQPGEQAVLKSKAPADFVPNVRMEIVTYRTMTRMMQVDQRRPAGKAAAAGAKATTAPADPSSVGSSDFDPLGVRIYLDGFVSHQQVARKVRSASATQQQEAAAQQNGQVQPNAKAPSSVSSALEQERLLDLRSWLCQRLCAHTWSWRNYPADAKNVDELDDRRFYCWYASVKAQSTGFPQQASPGGGGQAAQSSAAASATGGDQNVCLLLPRLDLEKRPVGPDQAGYINRVLLPDGDFHGMLLKPPLLRAQTLPPPKVGAGVGGESAPGVAAPPRVSMLETEHGHQQLRLAGAPSSPAQGVGSGREASSQNTPTAAGPPPTAPLKASMEEQKERIREGGRILRSDPQGGDLITFFVNRHNVLSWYSMNWRNEAHKVDRAIIAGLARAGITHTKEYLPRPNFAGQQQQAGKKFAYPAEADIQKQIEWMPRLYEHYPGKYVPTFMILVFFVTVAFTALAVLTFHALLKIPRVWRHFHSEE
ncbi:unnamed protein product [Amoebophrya sp. A25]|nr:unnamed protein product [Amoebophrya sp. A25]|eukprot:GSA25T00000996001.1